MNKMDILGSIDVNATILANRAKVVIAQTFTNNGSRAIETSYTFPVPPKAMVQGFTLTLGEKNVSSIMEETDKAYKEYDKAIHKGDTAGIIESIRKDILELNLGNILPGEVATITLTYLQEIPTTENKSQILLRIPFVVAPRYENNPTPENLRIQPAIGESHTVIHLKAAIRQHSSIQKISSPSHRIQTSIHGKKATVELALDNEKADSDFVLELTLAEDTSSYSYSEPPFTLIQVTPTIEETESLDTKQCTTTFGFLLDHSGSMEGTKLIQAKQALKLCLRQLSQGDKFTIVAFDDQFVRFSEAPVPYTDKSMQNADAWIDALTADGGTEILAPLESLFKSLSKVKNGIVLIFTDGQVSNEEQIIRFVEDHQDKITVFPFGIDTAVNESFITGIAQAGNGVAEFIYPGERIEDKVLRHFDRILSPSWENAKLWGALGEELEVIPRIPGKMFPRETYSFLYKQDNGSAPLPITLKASSQGKKVSIQIKESDGIDISLPSWWAITKIRSLEKDLKQMNPRRQANIKKEIVELSKKYQVLSILTSLLAIIPRKIKVKGVTEFIKVPVCAPRDWDMLNHPGGRKMSQVRLGGGLPEAEPFALHSGSYSAPSAMPPHDITNEVKTREDRFREFALLQKVNGAISKDGKESLYATALFILLFVKDTEAIQTYRKSIQKAVQYLLTQTCSGKEDFPLLQVCAFQIAMKAKFGDEVTLGSKMKECLNVLPASEKKIYDYFCDDNPTPLWRKIDSSITGSDTWEEICGILLAKQGKI